MIPLKVMLINVLFALCHAPSSSKSGKGKGIDSAVHEKAHGIAMNAYFQEYRRVVGKLMKRQSKRKPPPPGLEGKDKDKGKGKGKEDFEGFDKDKGKGKGKSDFEGKGKPDFEGKGKDDMQEGKDPDQGKGNGKENTGAAALAKRAETIMLRLFDAMDNNGDGTITKEECVDFADKLQDKLTEEQKSWGIAPTEESCEETAPLTRVQVKTLTARIANLPEKHLAVIKDMVDSMEKIVDIISSQPKPNKPNDTNTTQSPQTANPSTSEENTDSTGSPQTSNPTTSSECFKVEGDCDFNNNCVSSKNYPSNYGNSQVCHVLMLENCDLKAESVFEIDAGQDHLKINNKDVEKIEEFPASLPKGNEFMWSTGQKKSYKGWKVCFKPSNELEDNTNSTGSPQTSSPTTPSSDNTNSTGSPQTSSPTTPSSEDTNPKTLTNEDELSLFAL